MREKYGYEGQRPFAEEDNLCWFKGYHKGIGVSVLVCEYRLTAHSNDELASKKQEMQILAKTLDRVSRIEHRNIARIYDMIKTDNSLTVILEDCTGGTLIGILKNVKFIDERLALYILKQVSLGLDEMHQNNIAHGYINLENVQLDASGIWKLSMRSLILRAFYLSPQFKVQGIRSKQGDIFSLGTAFYKMMFGIFPYSGKTNEQIISNIKNGVRRSESILDSNVPFRIVVSKQVENLAFRMMHFQPDYRPDLKGIVSEVREYLKDEQLKSRSFPLQFENDYTVFGFCDRIETGSYTNDLLMTAIKKSSGQLRKVKIVTFGSQPEGGQTLDEYKKSLQRLSKWQNNQFIQIKEFFQAKNSLIIIYQYFNQNTLSEYLDRRKELKRDQCIEDNQIDQVISTIGQAVIAYQQNFQPHSWILLSKLYLMNGKVKLSEAAYESEDVRKRLYAGREQIDELAPQKKKSKNFVISSPHMDTWSLGVVYYKLLYGTYPTFDSTGTLIFPCTRAIQATQIQRLSYYLALNPKDRKNIIELDPLKEFLSQSIVNDKLARVGSVRAPQNQSRIRRARSPHKSMISQSRPTSHVEDSLERHDISDKPRPILKKENKKQQPPAENQQEQSDDDCFEKNCQYLAGCLSMQHLDEAGFFSTLTESWTRKVRYAIKIILCFAIYMLLFYMGFFRSCGNLLVNQQLYQAVIVTTRLNINDSVPTVNFSVVTTTPSYFSVFYNHTLNQLKVNMNCVQDNYYDPGPYGEKTYVSSYVGSSVFVSFEVVGFILIIVSLILKGIQICKLDLCRVMTDIRKTDAQKYSKVLSFVYTELGFASLISIHYLLYGSLYHMILTPCLQNPALPSVQKLFSGWVGTFVLSYIWQYIGLLVVYIWIIYFTYFQKKKDIGNYVWIILLAVYIAGIGTRGMGGFVSMTPYDTMVSVFGVCGELLQILTMVVCSIVDTIFWRALRRKSKVATHNKSKIQLFEQSNATIENSEPNNDMV